MISPFRTTLCLAIGLISTSLFAGEDANPSLLSVKRIFGDHEFEADYVSMRWLGDGQGYISLDPSTDATGGRDLVRHDTRSRESTILVPASALIPPGSDAPLAVDDYTFSSDQARVLIFTNSQRVWRTNSRGDYWVLDRSSHELHKLGGDAPPASLMHAKFAPDGLRAAYVRSNNIYVEDLRDHRITPLTRSTSPDEINGTFRSEEHTSELQSPA